MISNKKKQSALYQKAVLISNRHTHLIRHVHTAVNRLHSLAEFQNNSVLFSKYSCFISYKLYRISNIRTLVETIIEFSSFFRIRTLHIEYSNRDHFSTKNSLDI